MRNDKVKIINQNEELRNGKYQIKEKNTEIEMKIAEMDKRFEEMNRRQDHSEQAILTRKQVKVIAKDATNQHRKTNGYLKNKSSKGASSYTAIPKGQIDTERRNI